MRARSAERARLEPFTIVQQEDGGPAGSAFDHTESFSRLGKRTMCAAERA